MEEETGLKTKILDENIYAIQANSVQPHIKKGKFINTHAHFDIIYILEADDSIPLKLKEDENKGVKWIDFKDATDDSIVSFIRPIHKKLIERLKNYEKNI